MSNIIIVSLFVLQIIIMFINIFLVKIIIKRKNEFKNLLSEMNELDAEQKKFWEDLEKGRGLNK